MRARALRAGPALALAALCAVGAALRLKLVGQSFLSDELATYWDISNQSLGDLLSTIHSDAEISPPLSFVLSWTGLKVSAEPEWVRAFSLLAGMATIPVLYLIGRRISGRAMGITAAGLATFAPFMVFYSTEARGYGVLMLLVSLTTLFMLEALERDRWPWWAAYGVATCAAAYTHYTCVFVLAFQLAWLLWAHPHARRPALVANVLAAIAYIPWLSGLRADLDSPTTEILSLLQPFTGEAVRTSLGHWSIGYPYSLLPLRDVPGTPAMIMLGVACAVAMVAVPVRARRTGGPWLAAARHDAVLVGALALAVPVSAAVLSAVGDNLFSTRNLAASWPGLGLAVALLLVSAGPRLRFATAGLAVLALALGAVKLLDDQRQRPPYEEMAHYINANSRPGDVVIDETAVISPGPLSSIDPYLVRRGPVFRSLQPQQRLRPFSVADRVPSVAEAARRAVASAGGGRRIFLATDVTRAAVKRPLGRYRRVASRRWPGLFGIEVRVYAPPAS